jgi:hypothetical protein
MKDQGKIDSKGKGCKGNTYQNGTNEKYEGKECETRRQEVGNAKNHKV